MAKIELRFYRSGVSKGTSIPHSLMSLIRIWAAVRRQRTASRVDRPIGHQAPLEHDIFRDRRDTPPEHWTHFMRKPVIQIGALARRLNAIPDFRAGHGTDKEEYERLRRGEGEPFRFWFCRRIPDRIFVSRKPRRHRATS